MRNYFGTFCMKRAAEEQNSLGRSMRGLRRKFGGCGGMSLTETLVAILLLSLFTMTAASGIGAAVRLHAQSVTFSEAQTLSSTLMQALTDELRYARITEIESVNSGGSGTADQSTVKFDSFNYGANVSVNSEDGRVCVGGYDLIPVSAYTSGLEATAEVGYTEATGLFTVTLHVNKNNSELVSSTVTVRTQNP